MKNKQQNTTKKKIDIPSKLNLNNVQYKAHVELLYATQRIS